MTTRLIRSFYNVRDNIRNCVLTIGTFDGVHLGHQKLLKMVKERANALNTKSVVITFEPHPVEYFADKLTIARLSRLREKYYQIANFGIDALIVLPFQKSLASLSALEFTDLFCKYLAPQEVIVGDDFRFGRGRDGDIHFLKSLENVYGFAASDIKTVEVDEERVSSTRVRKALQIADLQLAEKLLGHPYTMMGRVRGGDKLGRKLGFKTANIFLHRKLSPLHGIFVVYVHGLHNKPLPGVANLGTRPTVLGTETLLEVHLLDFDQNIYGQYVTVQFCKKLRDEVKYPNLNLLIDQIRKDVNDAKSYFKKYGVL